MNGDHVLKEPTNRGNSLNVGFRKSTITEVLASYSVLKLECIESVEHRLVVTRQNADGEKHLLIQEHNSNEVVIDPDYLSILSISYSFLKLKHAVNVNFFVSLDLMSVLIDHSHGIEEPLTLDDLSAVSCCTKAAKMKIK